MLLSEIPATPTLYAEARATRRCQTHVPIPIKAATSSAATIDTRMRRRLLRTARF